MTPEDLDRFLVIAKGHGVRRMEMDPVSSGPLSIEFFPTQGQAALLPDMPKPTVRQMLQDDGSGLCECGHEMTSHNETGCLVGCDIDKCVPPDEAAT